MDHSKEIKAINNVYALLCVSLVLGFLPLMEAAFLAIVMFTVALASLYLIPNYNDTALTVCVDQVMNSMGGGMTNPAALENHLQPCMDKFIADNKVVFIISTIIAAAPIVIYLGYRLAKGISRASKGHRIGDVKSWF